MKTILLITLLFENSLTHLPNLVINYPEVVPFNFEDKSFFSSKNRLIWVNVDDSFNIQALKKRFGWWSKRSMVEQTSIF
jgi:hypothetical protein